MGQRQIALAQAKIRLVPLAPVLIHFIDLIGWTFRAGG
jgi:hypothetical protein